jgi:hypothetical protein
MSGCRFSVCQGVLAPHEPAVGQEVQMLGLLRYVDGDLNDPATYEAM